MGKIEGKKKEQGRKLPQIKGRHRCLKVKWKGKEERQKKRRRIEEGVLKEGKGPLNEKNEK